jgi:Zn-dependent protease with chaperone function
MNAQKKFHLLFSFIMAAMMVFLVTFVVTLANVGWVEHFVVAWVKSFMIAYLVAVPVIFFVAPVARRITARLLGVQAA